MSAEELQRLRSELELQNMSTEELQGLKNELLREQQSSHRPSSRDCESDQVELIFDHVDGEPVSYCVDQNETYLNLWDNQLTGEIPSEIGNLTNLTNLDLGVNQLTGEIPSWI